RLVARRRRLDDQRREGARSAIEARLGGALVRNVRRVPRELRARAPAHARDGTRVALAQPVEEPGEARRERRAVVVREPRGDADLGRQARLDLVAEQKPERLFLLGTQGSARRDLEHTAAERERNELVLQRDLGRD